MPQELSKTLDEQAREEAYYAWERAGRPWLSKADQDRMYFHALGQVQVLLHRRSTMAIDFQRQRATFPSHSGSAQSIDLAFGFPTNVRRAEAAINGFSMGFSQSDHHLFKAEVDTAVTSITGNLVRVRVSFALRDSSGFFDDRYDGFVDVMVIVDRV